MAVWSVVNKTELKEYFGRIDAEFYKPSSLNADKIIKNKKYLPLGKLVADGYRVVYENTKILSNDMINFDKDVRFLQAANISNDGMDIEVENIGFVSEKDWIRYPKGRIKHGEVLVEVKGQAEKVTIVQNDMPLKTLVTGTLFKMTINQEIVTSEYIFAFFNSKYGKLLRDRTKVNTLIAYVSKPELYKIPIPIFNKNNVVYITEKVKEAYSLQKKSKDLYNQATKLLEQELGLDKIEFEKKKSFTANFSEIVENNRCDSEFFDIKYKKIIEIIRKNNFTKLGEMFEISRGYCINPNYYCNEGVPYIRIKELSLNDMIDREKVVKISSQSNKKYLNVLKENDYILAVIGATIGKINHISKEFENSYFSNNTAKLRYKFENNFPFALELILRCNVVQMQIYQRMAKTAQEKIIDKELKKILIPILNNNTMGELNSLVLKSYEAKKQSKLLLEQAKKRVEELIEENAFNEGGQ